MTDELTGSVDEELVALDQRAADEQELVPLVPDQGEDESDAESGAAFVASIASKDWTVETLVSQLRKDRIDLSPSFQRRNAWLDNRKSKLIESILIGFPIPQIVLAEKRDAPGQYFVLDGKQRLLALRQYFVDTNDERDRGFDPFVLNGLEVLSDLNGVDNATLQRLHSDMAARLENATIRTVVLSDWNSEGMLLSLFLRLNTGSVPLSPQELRQALIPGRFMAWLDEASGQLVSLRDLLGNSRPDRRMVDAELMLRHLAFTLSLYQYRGNLKQFLDQTCETINLGWAALENSARDAIQEFDQALLAAQEYFGGQACRKWSGDHFERALNRAVFDVQIYSLAMPDVRHAVADNHAAVLGEFQRHCVENEPFLRSISTTTKTADAFVKRHETWREILCQTCSIDYAIPDALQR